MDPISLIVGALAAGAAAGLTDTAAGAVKDAYAGLRDLVRRRFAGRRVAQTALEEYERSPQVWQAPLSAELVVVGADTDAQIVAAAQRVMALVDEAGSASGKYLVDLRGAQGVQSGEGNLQINVYAESQSVVTNSLPTSIRHIDCRRPSPNSPSPSDRRATVASLARLPSTQQCQNSSDGRVSRPSATPVQLR